MIDILGKTQKEMQELAVEKGLKKFNGSQVAQWLYQKSAKDFESMTNLSKDARATLNNEFEIGRKAPISVQESIDGTKKYLFQVEKGFIETVVIPDEDRRTICVSSQAGCKWACKFCVTGKQGFQQNLSAGEIINQFLSVDEAGSLTNVVFMGMGEPLDNFEEVKKSIDILTSEWGFAMSPYRITVSSIGLQPNFSRLIEETRVHIALSLHSPFEPERLSLMPVEKPHPLARTLKALKNTDIHNQRKISFEYIVFKGINDSIRHAKKLVEITKGIKCKINLMSFHPFEGTEFESPEHDKITAFRDYLTENGLYSTIRLSKGRDIDAACGMLSTSKIQELQKPE
ncbi:MAG: 23S rRNA (adenine(2503)-C(2))-methyltransferase RlmN [Bacteroidales bacterium]